MKIVNCTSIYVHMQFSNQLKLSDIKMTQYRKSATPKKLYFHICAAKVLAQSTIIETYLHFLKWYEECCNMWSNFTIPSGIFDLYRSVAKQQCKEIKKLIWIYFTRTLKTQMESWDTNTKSLRNYQLYTAPHMVVFSGKWYSIPFIAICRLAEKLSRCRYHCFVNNYNIFLNK